MKSSLHAAASVSESQVGSFNKATSIRVQRSCFHPPWTCLSHFHKGTAACLTCLVINFHPFAIRNPSFLHLHSLPQSPCLSLYPHTPPPVISACLSFSFSFTHSGLLSDDVSQAGVGDCSKGNKVRWQKDGFTTEKHCKWNKRRRKEERSAGGINKKRRDGGE